MSSSEAPFVLEARNISKAFDSGQNKKIQILSHIDIHLKAGERVALLGKSGSGKSTLLHILGGLLQADEGTVHWQLNGKSAELSGLSDQALSRMRNTFLGFIFQFHHLLPEFTALENVMLPCLIAGNSEQKAKKEAKALLSHLGLSERMQHYPSDMSGGEQQRVSVCRALVNRPAVILADEPTGNLDLQNATEMLDLLAKVQQDFGMSMLIATHDHAVKSYCERVLTLNMEGLKQEE